MDHLIQSLLNLARVAAGGIARARVDLSALARGVADSLVAPDGNVRVEIESGLIAKADPGLAEIVLQNLLSNAVKFTARTPGAEIRVGARTFADGRRVFYVADNGAGFDPAHAGRLFGTFERLHSEGEFPGTGIGLATVKRIIDRHRGRLWAEGQPGHGATFWFTFGVGEQADGSGGDADRGKPA
jgi:signal transduction histidine kinase